MITLAQLSTEKDRIALLGYCPAAKSAYLLMAAAFRAQELLESMLQTVHLEY